MNDQRAFRRLSSVAVAGLLSACSAHDLASPTQMSFDVQPGAPVASLTITPAQPALTVGDTLRLAATPRDAAGNELSRTIAWRRVQGIAAMVDTRGLLVAMTAGVARIEAMAGEVTRTVDVVVTVPPPPPPPPPPPATPPPPPPPAGLTPPPWLEEEFQYGSTQEMMSDPRNIYTQNEDENAARIALDTAGFDAAGNSMRYDYADRTSLGGSGTTGRCTDYSIGRNLTLPSPVREVWAEFWVRFSPGFTTIAPVSWGCRSNPDLKLIFGRLNGINGRFTFKVGQGGSMIRWGYSGAPQAEDQFGVPMAGNPVFDGQWHRIRLHLKLSTTATSADGAEEVWLDNTYLGGTRTASIQSGGVAATGIYGLALGRNMNQGPGLPQSVWWGRIRVWNSDPGF